MVGLARRGRRREGRLPLRARLRRAAPGGGAGGAGGALPPGLRRAAVLPAGQGAPLWDGELPRTSTRKVKRKLVVEELQAAGEASPPPARRAQARGAGRLDGLAAARWSPRSSASRSAEVSPESRLRGGSGLRLADAHRAGGGAGGGGRAPARGAATSPGSRRWTTCAACWARARPAASARGSAEGVSPTEPSADGRSAGDPRPRRRWPAWAARCSTLAEGDLRRRLRGEGHRPGLRAAEPELPGRRQPQPATSTWAW